MSDEQRTALERMARSTSLPHRSVNQAKALLWAADGEANEEIARRCRVDADAVRRWRRRFEERGVDGVGVIAKGRGRKSWLPEGTVAEIVRITMEETPIDTSTHWTTRSLAERMGVGKDTVARVWRDHNLKPKRHTAKDVLAFFKLVDLYVPRHLEVHVVLDNLSAHMGPEVTRWLDHPRRARWHLHFTPTSSS